MLSMIKNRYRRILNSCEQARNEISMCRKEIENAHRQTTSHLRKLGEKTAREERDTYRQIESLIWLTKVLTIPGRLPHLRGWAASPDLLLDIHESIRITKPEIVLEFGSGASTVVIADAIKTNGHGRLYSIDHSAEFANETSRSLKANKLSEYVDLRVGKLESWNRTHLNGRPESLWYPVSLLQDIQRVDMVIIDGPPGPTGKHARYPAIPSVIEKSTRETTFWLDDADRAEETQIYKAWCEQYQLNARLIDHEKGLALLTFQ